VRIVRQVVERIDHPHDLARDSLVILQYLLQRDLREVKPRLELYELTEREAV